MAEWLRGHDGVASAAQLRRLGLSRSAIQRRVDGGQLRAVFRGIYAAAQVELGPPAWWRAAVLAIGPGAALSLHAAAARWGFADWRGGPVDVTVARSVRSRPGIRLHVVAELPAADVLAHRDVPITTVERTLRDLAATDMPERSLRRAVNEALVLRLTSVPALLAAATAAKGRRGAPRLAALLDAAAPTESHAEDDFVAFCVAQGLPRPVTQHRIGPYRVDAFFPEHGLVVEIDSRYHDTPLRQADDRARQADLEAAGHGVMRLRRDDLRRRPTRTAAGLRAALPYPSTAATAAAGSAPSRTTVHVPSPS